MIHINYLDADNISDPSHTCSPPTTTTTTTDYTPTPRNDTTTAPTTTTTDYTTTPSNDTTTAPTTTPTTTTNGPLECGDDEEGEFAMILIANKYIL